MTIQALQESPSLPLAKALEEFERKFVYPLGPGKSFRISHSPDYSRFYRSMGDARCFIASKGDRVIGSLAVAVRQLTLPDGSRRTAAYIGDLKIDPDAPHPLALLRTAQAADAWARPQVTAAFAVVMDGTRRSPMDYTGRVGIQPFAEVGKVMVLQLPTKADDSLKDFTCVAETHSFDELARGCFYASGGSPSDRSDFEPFWIIHNGGRACGRLENTRRAKRLIGNDGVEMRSAHLACFACSDAGIGARLINEARYHAAIRGFTTLFVGVSQRDFPAVNAALGSLERVIAPATIFGAGLQPGTTWNINTSEI